MSGLAATALRGPAYVDPDGADRLLTAALVAPEPDDFTRLLDVQVFPLAQPGQGKHAVSFAYDVPCAQAMRALGGRFHKPATA